MSKLSSRIFGENRFRANIVRKTGAMLSLLLCLTLLAMLPVSAQTTSGQISGNVVDSGGAALPDATITATQVGTGTERTVTTSSDGNYTITDLPIGIYRVSIKKTGFKESVVDNVVVNVASVTRQDVSLQVGEVGEVVTISADSIQVETQTGAIGEVVTGQQVRELPLNGRSFVQLTQLQPGVAPQNNFASTNKGLFAGVDFSVNGNSAQSNLFLTDGANNNDTGSNRTILLYPSIEAIAEFKMLRNSYGPEFGQAAGSVISIVTRGGENQFHGSLFYFGRNDALNSREYFTTRAGIKEPDLLRRNDFGFSLGGPLPFFNFGEGGPAFISGRDKLFFFYSQEWNKEIRGATRFGSVPTAAERVGDFRNRRIQTNGNSCSGGAIGNARPGSDTQVVPTASISPAGLLIAQLFPLPNVAWSPASETCTNWAQSANSPIEFREENVRIDYIVNDKNRIFGRYTQDTWKNPFPILLGGGLWGDDAFPTVETDWSQPARQAAFKLTSTLSNTSVNEVQFSYSANRINVTSGQGGELNAAINGAVPGFFPDSAKVNGLNRPHPVFWGGISPFNYGTGVDLWTQAPFRNSLDIYSIRDDFSKVAGNHTVKMGFLFDKAAKDEDSGPNNETVQFWGDGASRDRSGNHLADILTRGSIFGFSENSRQAVGKARYSNLEFYLGDTWKVRPYLTLELGARYSIYYEPYDEDNAISGFDPALYNPNRPPTDPCNGLIVPKGAGNPCANVPGASAATEFSNRSLRENNYKNIAPRLGVAWDVFRNGKTAFRAGFGQFFLRERIAPYVAALTGNPPFVRSIGGERTLDGSAYFGLPASAGAGSPSITLNPEAKTPYSLQYNVTVDQELYKGAVLEVSYVGNRARNQLTQFDLNAVLPQFRTTAAFAADGNAVNQFRPYRNYGSIYQIERSGRANYNSLQMLFKTRFLNNSQIQAAYTYSNSKADFGLGDSSGGRSDFALLDANDRDLDYGPSDINRPHMFVANAIINLPSLRGSNSLVRAALGGWELASIVQFTSGASLTPRIGATALSYDLDGIPGGDTRSFQAGVSGTGTAVVNQRPLLTGADCRVNNDNLPEFLVNPAAYTFAGYRIGTNGSNESKGACQGAPIKNVDVSFYKNFTPSWLKNSFFGEDARIQFRMEFFNAFNTPQFRGDTIGTFFLSGQVLCGTAACSPTNNTITGLAPGATIDPTFGRAGRTRGPREIQYALKLVF